VVGLKTTCCLQVVSVGQGLAGTKTPHEAARLAAHIASAVPWPSLVLKFSPDVSKLEEST
jgi:hypothetical protein